MEGLDQLVHLEDLSLYSNLIPKVEGISNLTELKVFSIGKNQLTNLEDVNFSHLFQISLFFADHILFEPAVLYLPKDLQET